VGIVARMCRQIPAVLAALALLAGCATAPRNTRHDWPRYTLQATQVVVLNSPDGRRFDASALCFLPDGSLLTIDNLRPQLCRIALTPGADTARLVPLEQWLTPAQLAPFASIKRGAYDCEGIARDERGRLYICEEANRWVLRCDPASGRVERLLIDLSPVEHFFSADPNASFEGVAVGRGKLYLANERNSPLVITVDLETLRVTDWFRPQPRKPSFLGTHYSDLCWFEGKLWVLCRQHRVVLAVNPATHDVLAEFDYEAVEDALGYRKTLPAGIMEGLAVDRDSIWLVTDNNGWPRKSSAADLRPTLVRCPRPDK
jgi:hypothetical protein